MQKIGYVWCLDFSFIITSHVYVSDHVAIRKEFPLIFVQPQLAEKLFCTGSFNSRLKGVFSYYLHISIVM